MSDILSWVQVTALQPILPMHIVHLELERNQCSLTRCLKLLKAQISPALHMVIHPEVPSHRYSQFHPLISVMCCQYSCSYMEAEEHIMSVEI